MQGRWQSSVTLSREAYETASKSLHPTNNAFLESKMELANALRDAAKYPESEMLLREVIRTRASMLAPDDIDENMLNCLQTLALLIEMQGNYDESERILRQVILARSLSLGMENPLVLVDVHNLCRSLINQGKYAECEIKTRQVLTALTRLLGPERTYFLRASSLPFRSPPPQGLHQEF
jgi:tetratricopeptide (TPR) repeat protein